MNSKDFLKEGFIEDAYDVHVDHEVQMAREECYHAAENALALHKLLRNISEQQGLEGWVSAKITLANEYLNTVREHLEYELLNPQGEQNIKLELPVAESATGDAPIDKMSDKELANYLGGTATANWVANHREQAEEAAREKSKKMVAEGKKSDRYHIVGKDGKPVNLASYPDRASAIKDRDEKYPGAVVQQVGPRGKVKGVAEQYDRSVDIGQQMANDGITYSPDRENEIIGKMAEYMKRSGFSSKEIRYLMNYDEDYIADQLSYLPREQGVAKDSEEKELYGLHIGDTVKAEINGRRVQGDVIDIFPETMEVELLLRGPNAGKTVTVDVRDTEYLGEQGVAESKKKESNLVVQINEPLAENLRNWFKEKWVRFGPDGKIRGDCARGDKSEGKPKCLPQAKAHALGKKGRKTAASRKRREDPNPERRGPAINVKTKESLAVIEGTESQYIAARYIDEFADGDHWYVKGAPDVIKKFVLLANSLEDEAVKGTEYEPDKGMMAKVHAQLDDDSVPQWTVVKAQNLEQLKPIGNRVLQLLMKPDLSYGAQEFMSELLWTLEEKGLALVTGEPQQGVAEGIFNFKKQPMPEHGDELKIGDRHVMFDDGGSHYGVSWIKQDRSEAYEEFDKSEYTNLDQLKKAIWDEIKYQDQQGVAEDQEDTLYDKLTTKYPKTKLALDLLPPTAVATSAADTVNSLSKQAYGDAALNAMGLIPGLKPIAKLTGLKDIAKIEPYYNAAKIADKSKDLSDYAKADLDPRSSKDSDEDYSKISTDMMGTPLSKKQSSIQENLRFCPECKGPLVEFSQLSEKKDACYYKVKSRYKVWPSAYASGALVKCRKKGAKNWGNKSESVSETAGATTAGAVATINTASSKPKSQVGTLFGGTYKQKKTKK